MKSYVLHIIIIFIVLFITPSIFCQIESPPKIPQQNVVEEYCGREIVDSYRNLEDLTSDTVQNWFKNQNLYCNKVLNKIKEKEILFNDIKDLDQRKSTVVSHVNILSTGEYFFLKRDSSEVSPRVIYRKSVSSKDSIIYQLPIPNKNKIINFIKPSWSGKYLAISITSGGSEISEISILNLSTGNLLPQKITNCWPSEFGLSWLPDNSGFIYVHLPIIDNKNPDFLKNTSSVLYSLGQDPKNLNIVFSAKNNPELDIKPEDFPIVEYNKQDDKFFIAKISGATKYNDSYFCSVKNFLNDKEIFWQKLYSKNDFISKGVYQDNKFICLSSFNASNFKIKIFDLKNGITENSKVLVKEDSTEVINDFLLQSGSLFYSTYKNGVLAKLYVLEKNSKVPKQITLPKTFGNISLFKTPEKDKTIGLVLKGWINDSERFLYDFEKKSFSLENIVETSNYSEFSDFEVKEVEVPSHDGALVPLSIIYKKGTKMSGNNSTLIMGYGAYGTSLNPSFTPTYLSWVKNGGVFCVAHVRGGGEKGDKWRIGGFQSNKSNSWKDLIACTEYLIKKRYCSKNTNAIYSASAGGVLLGRAITERPDLFGAAIIRVGVMTTYRKEFAPNGANNTKEYGSILDPDTCEALLDMDPYLNLKKNVDYPGMMLTAGMNDTRVAPYIPGKFVAKLQDFNTSQNPILFKVNLDGGHGMGGTDPNIKYREFADLFSFAFWQTGHPDYQPQE